MTLNNLENILPENFDHRERQLANFVHVQHGDQIRKYTDAPYITHLIKVAVTVKTYSGDPVLPATALCHDLFEDTDCTEQLLSVELEQIGYDSNAIERIIRYTWELTDRYTKKVHAHLSRAERKRLEAQRLIHIKACSAIIKCADILDNAPSIAKHDPSFARVYVNEVMSFLPAMKKGHPELFAKTLETCKKILEDLPGFSSQELRKISKTLSLVLRHRPELFGLKPNAQGWCEVDRVLKGFASRSYFRIDRRVLEEVVERNDKKRFAFSADGRLIRASQGHSIPIDLGYEQETPPPFLFHGTAQKHLASIKREGLKRKRHHVHLSPDYDTAQKVGSRHGKPVILKIDTGRMHKEGYVFYHSTNGVWLVEDVPTVYIEEVSGG